MNLSDQDALLLGLAGYAATKMWNVANHERKAIWQETGKIPGFVDQCKTLKNNRWYKRLPSQTAQEALAELDDSYLSWYSHRKNGDLSAKPPGFRQKDTLSTNLPSLFVEHSLPQHTRAACKKGSQRSSGAPFDQIFAAQAVLRRRSREIPKSGNGTRSPTATKNSPP